MATPVISYRHNLLAPVTPSTPVRGDKCVFMVVVEVAVRLWETEKPLPAGHLEAESFDESSAKASFQRIFPDVRGY